MKKTLSQNFVYLKNFHCTTYDLMPKKRTKLVVEETSAAEVVKSRPVSEGKSGIEIKILAKPGAKFNSVTDISDVVSVQIAAPPVDGEANSELVKYLAKILDLKKSQVTLDKGSKSRSKTVLISGNTCEEILKKLQEEKS